MEKVRFWPYEDIEGNFAFSNQGSNEVNSSVEEVSGKEISKIIFDYISANPQCRDGLAILVWTGSLSFIGVLNEAIKKIRDLEKSLTLNYIFHGSR